MIDPKTKEVLEQLAQTHFARALNDLLDEELARIDTVKGVKTLEEAIGRQKAVESLERIFSFLGRDTNSSLTRKKINFT